MTCPITADRDEWRGAVTQADRDAAAWLQRELGDECRAELCEDGDYDSFVYVEASARHRQQAEASFKAREDALAELLEIALDEYETRNGRTKSLPHWSHTARNVLLARAHTATDAERPDARRPHLYSPDLPRRRTRSAGFRWCDRGWILEFDMTQELLPCPFCSGEAVFISRPQSAEVHCLPCTASVSEMTKAEAITAWNTRASFATIPDPEAYMKAARGMREALERVKREPTAALVMDDATNEAVLSALAAFDTAQGEQ